MPLTGSPFGAAGGSIQSRYSVEGDPRKAIPVYAAGTMDVSSPPHQLGLKGSAYKYGSQVIGGTRNMIHNGGEAHSCYNPLDMGSVYSLTLGLNTDGISALQTSGGDGHVQIQSTQFASFSTYILDAFGEMIYQPTIGTAGQFGAIHETFTAAGTVSQVTNGSPTITFAGSALTTISLTAAYAYTPSKTLVQPGDIVAITQGGTVYYHRIKSIDSPTQLTVWPNWGGTSAGPGAGLGFSIYRTGYGSYSRVVQFFNSSNGKYYCYYAGNSRDTQNFGTIECYILPDNTHFMCPQNASNLDVIADDIILYKGFMLYGAGTSIQWTATAFPTAFPFAAADFPASNITVVDPSDQFISFEQIGDQLIAMFRNSLWLVYPTGSLPEFNFYRLPEPIGVSQNNTFNNGNLAQVIYLRTRPTATGRAAVFYVSKSGLMVSQGGPSQPISEAVSAFWGNSTHNNSLQWEPVTDSVIWGSGAKNLLYTAPTQSWSVLDVSFRTGNMIGITGEFKSTNGFIFQSFRRFGPAFWDSTTQTMIIMDSTNGGIDVGNTFSNTTNLSVWGWNTPILNLSDIYDNFQFGGFRIEGRGPGGITGGINWVIWGGPNPYSMIARQSGVITQATANARQLLGNKFDDAFIGIQLSGAPVTNVGSSMALTGILLYNAADGPAKAAR